MTGEDERRINKQEKRIYTSDYKRLQESCADEVYSPSLLITHPSLSFLQTARHICPRNCRGEAKTCGDGMFHDDDEYSM